MKNILKLFFVVFFFILTVQNGFSKEKVRIAVLDFKETGNKVDELGPVAANKINDYLVNLGTVTVIDRANLEQILAEQNMAMSGVLDGSLASLAGKISGLDYLVLGEVSKAVITKVLKTKTKTVKENGVKVKKEVKYWLWTGTGMVQIRLVNTTTGKVVYSGTKKGSLTKNEDYVPPPKESSTVSLIKAIKGTDTKKKEDPNTVHPDLAVGAVAKAASGFQTDFYNLFRPSGYIISIEPEDEKGKKMLVTIDIGEEFGIKRNEQYEVLKIGKPIIHPKTKEEIPGKETVIHKLRIKDIDSQMSTAIVRKKDAKLLKVGMPVKARKKSTGIFRY